MTSSIVQIMREAVIVITYVREHVQDFVILRTAGSFLQFMGNLT